MAKTDIEVFEIEPYGYTVYCTKTVKDFNKLCKKFKALPLDKGDRPAGALQGCSKRIFIFGLFEDDLGVLCHEINHLCIKLFNRLEAPIIDDNSELYCYLHQHLFYKLKAIYQLT